MRLRRFSRKRSPTSSSSSSTTGRPTSRCDRRLGRRRTHQADQAAEPRRCSRAQSRDRGCARRSRRIHRQRRPLARRLPGGDVEALRRGARARTVLHGRLGARREVGPDRDCVRDDVAAAAGSAAGGPERLSARAPRPQLHLHGDRRPGGPCSSSWGSSTRSCALQSTTRCGFGSRRVASGSPRCPAAMPSTGPSGRAPSRRTGHEPFAASVASTSGSPVTHGSSPRRATLPGSERASSSVSWPRSKAPARSTASGEGGSPAARPRARTSSLAAAAGSRHRPERWPTLLASLSSPR